MQVEIKPERNGVFVGSDCPRAFGIQRAEFCGVETKSKLIEVALKIFGIDAMMGAIQPSFQVPNAR